MAATDQPVAVDRGTKRSLADDSDDGRYHSLPSPKSDAAQAASRTKHRRNYQACEPCRARKVRCDLGDVDNPSTGPCAKCAREKKRCYFSDKRRKSGSPERQPSTPTTKRDRSEDVPPQLSTRTGHGPRSDDLSHTVLTSPFVQHTSPPVVPHHVPHHPSYTTATANYILPPVRNPPTNTFTPMSVAYSAQSRPALRTSQVDKAGETGDKVMISNENPIAKEPYYNTQQTFSTLLAAASYQDRINHDGHQMRRRAGTLTGNQPYVDLEQMNADAAKAYKEGVAVWSRTRFVRAGWFTAQEAMKFVDYFFERMQPMTPVINQTYRNPRTHAKLLTDEPVLAMAILAIASRHVTLATSAPVTRNHWIHNKLWEALRDIIQRLLWGQEQFGGGFCAAGATAIRHPTTGQITWKGSLRTLGTVQALLLLTDWQPRALHFPPGDDENTIVDVDNEQPEGEAVAPKDSDTHVPYAFWLEPAWRSDRMSWMLLGLAQSLSYELGVFDREHERCTPAQKQHTRACIERRQIRRLLFIYVSQISGRISIQSMLSPEQVNDEYGASDTAPDDAMHKLWYDIAEIMYYANKKIFVSKDYTAELVSSGRYRKILADGFTPALERWAADFQRNAGMLTPHMRSILKMEYEYARMFLNSLGLQSALGGMISQGAGHNGHTGGPSKQFLPLLQENKLYINETRNAAQNILTESSQGLGSLHALADAPIRTFLRTLSGMMFTLKLFSLGNEASQVRRSMKLIARTCELMEKQFVDDVHLSPPTAKLMLLLLENVQKNLIRVPKGSSRNQSRQISPSRVHSLSASHHHTQPHQQQQQQQHHLHKTARSFPETIDSQILSPSIDSESPDMLANIPLAHQDQSFIPPFPISGPDSKNFDVDMTYLDPASIDSSMFPMTNEDWISLPINHMFEVADSNNNAVVSQGYGGIGPVIGDRDVLGLLTGNAFDQQAWPTDTGYHPGNSFTNGL